MTDQSTGLQQRLDHLASAPFDAAAWKSFAAAATDGGSPIHWLDAALSACPGREEIYLAFADAWARAGMGERVRPAAVPQQGVVLLRRALAETPPGPMRTTIHSNLCFLLNELGDHAAAEVHGRLAAGCPNQIYHLWLAESLFRQKKFTSDPLCVVDFSTLDTALIQRAADQTPAAVGPAAGTVVLLSVDGVYFRRFAVALLLSARQAGSAFRFHFHILNADAATLAVVETIRSRITGMQVDFTTEPWTPQGGHSDRVYYACSRMLIARRIMERTRCDVIITDADVLFRRAPDDFVRRDLAGMDIGTVHYWGEPMCNRYNASFFVIRYTPLGLLFLRMVEEFLIQNFRTAYLWMIDQVALYCCEQRLAAVTNGAVKTHYWPESVVSIHQLPDSPIWSGATTAKWTDTPYNRYRHQLLAGAGFDPAALDSA